MTVFTDSSALVKLYADEPGHEVVRAEVALVASQLARVEVQAALWRKHRLHELGAADAALLVAAFEADCFGADGDAPRFAAVVVTAAVLDDAARAGGRPRSARARRRPAGQRRGGARRRPGVPELLRVRRPAPRRGRSRGFTLVPTG